MIMGNNNSVDVSGTVATGSGALLMQGLARVDGINPEFASRLFDLFVEDSYERLQRIEDRLEAGDTHGAWRQVHALKSGCMQIGASAMTRCGDILSAALAADSVDLARAALLRLWQVFRDSQQRF
ncbi:MAG: Hpt domain-containing protein [Spiribacter salinus]|uniref:Hpt domain-containing protein n=1 Tax=Spiribacter salinus TaxID=1335746 RepID=A0A540VS79_9GAMM|nr:MAG: Hpt domain-containing protein [Spiribacter salinus]TQE99728.1 MAG: Hpt domain-containing protein [Spiribacter salinus]